MVNTGASSEQNRGRGRPSFTVLYRGKTRRYYFWRQMVPVMSRVKSWCTLLDEFWSRQGKTTPYHVKQTVLIRILAFS
jgi:hypothetical protein